MQPSIGRIVLYALTEHDAQAINKHRADFGECRKTDAHTDTGYVAHYGSEACTDDTYPAIIIRVRSDDLVNAKVLLDGTDTYWATSRH